MSLYFTYSKNFLIVNLFVKLIGYICFTRPETSGERLRFSQIFTIQMLLHFMVSYQMELGELWQL